MPNILNTALQLLQGSALGELVRNSQYLYPVIEATHILGIALLVGPAFAFDLRIFGYGRRVVSVTTAARHLLPVSHVGFAVTIVTGIALLSAQATMVAAAGAAPWKLGLILVAGVNVAMFHLGIYRSVGDWAGRGTTPISARIGAGVSLVTWTGVIFAGRLLAYT
ncbi:hypothetical protein ACLNGM_17205 [Aureimonas phyllosphaerae]|uniref:hypothetical protein n=1 Tax=Aureimonas phyllosphaerae TaxID=1166078 RepID=UPI003A5BAE20